MVFLNFFFEIVDFEKHQHTTNKFPGGKGLTLVLLNQPLKRDLCFAADDNLKFCCQQTILMKYHTLFFRKFGKMSQNLLSAAVVIGALRVN